MSRRSNQFAARREALQLQSAAQRPLLALAVADIRSRLQPIDHVIATFQGIRTSSVVVAGVAGLALALFSSRTTRFISRSAMVLTALRQIWKLLNGASGSAGEAEFRTIASWFSNRRKPQRLSQGDRDV